MWKIFFEYMDKSKITLTGKGSDISLRLAMKYDNLYNREAVRAEYQRYPKNKYAAIPLEAKIRQFEFTHEGDETYCSFTVKGYPWEEDETLSIQL